MSSTDIEALSRLINFPFRPVSVRWRTEKFAHGDDWGLQALLWGQPGDLDRLMQSAETLPNCRPRVPQALLATWFPSEVQAHAGATVDGGMVNIEATCIRPTPFTMPEKSPAIHGSVLVLVKPGLVFLDLYTM